MQNEATIYANSILRKTFRIYVTLSSRPRNVSLWNVACERSDEHECRSHIDQRLMIKLPTQRLGTGVV
jgi:hypothetical protein